jgi:predicted nucleic acid-binding Zn ribbon protein
VIETYKVKTYEAGFADKILSSGDMAASRECVICDSPVRGGDRTCDRAACRHRYRLDIEGRQRICCVCGRPLKKSPQVTCSVKCATQLNDFVRQEEQAIVGRCCRCEIYTTRRNQSGGWECGDGVCELIGVFSRVQTETRQAFLEQKEQLQTMATQLRDDFFAKLEGPFEVPRAEVAPKYLVVVVPHTVEPMAERVEARFEQLRQHIAKRVETAFNAPESPDDTPYTFEQLPAGTRPRELPLFVAGCSACRGKCCLRGGVEHAFISVSTIRRFMANHPNYGESPERDSRGSARSLHGSCAR